jgi:hypothetical protein
MQSSKGDGRRLQETEILNGLREGIEQASKCDRVKNPPDFEADLRKARKAMEEQERKKSKS